MILTETPQKNDRRDLAAVLVLGMYSCSQEITGMTCVGRVHLGRASSVGLNQAQGSRHDSYWLNAFSVLIGHRPRCVDRGERVRGQRHTHPLQKNPQAKVLGSQKRLDTEILIGKADNRYFAYFGVALGV
jgi:hypothetical protein